MANIKEIAFIDPAVGDIDTLIAGLQSKVTAVRPDSATPAMAQIAASSARWRAEHSASALRLFGPARLSLRLASRPAEAL